MADLLGKLVKTGFIKDTATLDESTLFQNKDVIPTDVPIINMAFSGDLEGGLVSGLTTLAGESKSFKTMLSLYCLKAFQDKYEDSVCLFYDCEFGVTDQYLKSFGIDTTRIIHIPTYNIEDLKFDLMQKLEAIERKDNVFILVDSLGNMASKKEVDDAKDAKAVADMSRAKQIKSLFRIITPHLVAKDIPAIIIAHIYSSQGMFAKNIISGGTGIMYSSNQAFIITKAQEKTGTEVTGYRFTLTVEKSRFVKEKSKFPFSVDMNEGINKFSSLMDIALDSGHVVKPSNGWYQKVDMETGELIEGKYRLSDTNTTEFWEDILEEDSFKSYIRSKYQYGNS